MRDQVLVATNDALIVQRGASTISVTWRDWQTIVGTVEGPLARVALQEALPNGNGCKFADGCCNAVKNTSFAAPVTSRYWRFGIEASFDGEGSTLCFVGFRIGGKWVTDPSWSVSAAYHPNGPPASVLTRDCASFWNSAAGPRPTTAAPLFLTIDLKAELEVTAFQYSIYNPTEAPKAFVIQTAASNATTATTAAGWTDVGTWGNATNDGCAGAGGGTKDVNVSTSPHDVLALATRPTGTGGMTFALTYGEAGTGNATMARAETAAASADVGAVIADRNKYITDLLPPMPDAGDDRFQRKMLSVMKVNSLSPEGAINHNWSTTCRAPHKWMYLWDGMFQALSMSHVDPDLALDYFSAFFQFQDNASGHLCSIIGPPSGLVGGKCSADASVPNVAMMLLDNYRQKPNLDYLKMAFPKLERYIQWYRTNRKGPATAGGKTVTYLLRWDDAGEAGMDHEQNFCPGDTFWTNGCSANHFALDFANYLVYESQAMAKMAALVGLPDRAAYWTALATNVTKEMDELLWDEETGFYYDMWFNGTLMPMKTVAGLYPLMVEGMNRTRVEKVYQMLKSPDFWTTVPVPTVAVSTPDFSTDLDRGPMWQQQNVYIIRGLRLYGYDKDADELKAISLKVVRDYYEKWGTVFEFYDALNTTDPTQTLRKPSHRDVGKCTPGVMGLEGHCGAGGIRDYNFCAGIALLWHRGGE